MNGQSASLLTLPHTTPSYWPPNSMPPKYSIKFHCYLLILCHIIPKVKGNRKNLATHFSNSSLSPFQSSIYSAVKIIFLKL